MLLLDETEITVMDSLMENSASYVKCYLLVIIFDFWLFLVITVYVDI